jgi:CRISPR-associated endonuclease/helicase Cas3
MMNEKEIYARKCEIAGKVYWQTLEEHLNNVAERCARHAEAFDSAGWGRLIGQLHDIGKARQEFQDKLNGRDLHVDHSGAGAVLLSGQKNLPESALLMAFAAAGHHAGLPDRTHLDERLRKNESVLSQLGAFNRMPDFDATLPEWLQPGKFRDRKSMLRSFEFWTRFLFSALVDADRLDAECFEFRAKLAEKMEIGTGREVNANLSTLRERLDVYIDTLASEKEKSRVNTARAVVLQSCREAALLKPGFFSLTVPTGGGKTLSGMSFALHHALQYGMRRVICVIPYTSIIEQNASVYRKALGCENVLEHHCNFSPEKESSGNAKLHSFDEKTLTLFEKAAENWDFPIIVTTTIQFFESLFANGAGHCRKLHNIARSVIILDEAQSLPPKFLNTILDGMRELVEHYGCSIVISTATQPALETRQGFSGLENVRPIIAEPQKLFRDLRRVCCHWPKKNERLSGWEELAQDAQRHKRVLLITHKRKDARALTKELKRQDPVSPLFHLSAQMCPAHRFDTLDRISAALKNSDLPCRVVSTQLVEAGVDLDFGVVYRALGGLDSIAQAAGRCNREGREELGHVYIYRFTEPPAGVPRLGLDTCEAMLNEAESDGKELDLDNPQIFVDYFRNFYVKRPADPVPAYREKFAYEKVDECFKIIEEERRKSIVVPYEGAGKVIDEIKRDGWSRASRRKLQQFTVQITERDFKEMFGALEEISENVYMLSRLYRDSYDPLFGLLPPDEMKVNIEDCIN